MTAGTIAGTGRNSGNQIRNDQMTEGAIIEMGYRHGRIGGGPRIVTSQAGGRYQDIAARHMVDMTVDGQLFVRMTGQTRGRIGTQGDGVDHLLARASVAGGTGTETMGGHIMGGINFIPSGRSMTDAAEQPRRSVGEIIGTNHHGVFMITMNAKKDVAVSTADLIALQAILNRLANQSGINALAGVVMAQGTVGTVQAVNIAGAAHAAAARGT